MLPRQRLAASSVDTDYKMTMNSCLRKNLVCLKANTSWTILFGADAKCDNDNNNNDDDDIVVFVVYVEEEEEEEGEKGGNYAHFLRLFELFQPALKE
jgi:hypothetical protein